MSIICFIPARYGSSRLPGKPLLEINGKPIIQRTFEQTQKSKLIDETYVLTDNEKISSLIESIGGKSIIIKEECNNGTERICLALKKIYCEVSSLDSYINIRMIVNVQGDEPYINPEHIDICIKKYLMLTKKELEQTKCTTLHYEIKKREKLESVTCGKMVLDKYDNVMYCSRNIIPWNKKNTPKQNPDTKYFGHIGMFCFEPIYLRDEYMPTTSRYQMEEDIEWLKILEDGYKINSVLINEDTEIGVNTSEDYNYLCRKYTKDITRL